MQGAAGQDVQSRLRRALIQTVFPDGGWPYYRGQGARIESTCWAVLALSGETTAADRPVIESAFSFLRRLQQGSGLLVEAGAPSPNMTWNGLALLTDVSVSGPSAAKWRDAVREALLAAKGVALDSADSPVRQNSRLQAWSWTEGTFSWIEPTATCLLALKKAKASGPLATTRVREAEAVLLDRVCDGGGWNYGNAQVLGQDLRPYVPTTALALLAMQDRRTHPDVSRSLDWLVANAVRERSAMALSLAVICLRVFGRSTESIRAVLAQQESATRFLDNLHLTAMALYALTVERHGARAFDLA